ncbi:MAG: hypothetical protein H7Y17_02710, partial [Chlorobia bacterium]|nr:hypothetical protein [Fimbriimonadaceae bacterium]
IGDSDTLKGALELPEGVLYDMRQIDAAMAVVSKVDKQRLPAFTGSTTKRIGIVPKDSK